MQGDSPDSADRSAWRWVVTLAAGPVAGLAAWLGGEACLDMIQTATARGEFEGAYLEYHQSSRSRRSPTPRTQAWRSRSWAARWGRDWAWPAALLPPVGAARLQCAAVLGLVVGAAAAPGVAGFTCPPTTTTRHDIPTRPPGTWSLPLLVHAGIWSAVGALAGLAYGVGLGKRRLVAADRARRVRRRRLGSMAYELVGAVAVPRGQTTQFVSATWQTRLLARLAVTVLAAAGVALAATGPEKQTPRPAS